MARWDRRDAKRAKRGPHRHKTSGRSVFVWQEVERKRAAKIEARAKRREAVTA